MITLDLLNDFIVDDLSYKPSVKVISYEINKGCIHIIFGSGMGELVKLERIYKWINEKRDEKISQLLD